MRSKVTSTPAPGQPRPIPFPLVLFLVAVLVLLACLGAWAMADNGPRGRVDATDGVPLSITPQATVPAPPVTHELTLALDLPALTDEQRWWLHTAQALPRLPIAFGVDQPPIAFTDNEAVVYDALLYTECRLEPFWEDGSFKVNEIGATGCGQLMGALITPETASNPNANIYASAAEFRRLLDANDGDIMQSIRNYKGVTTWDTSYQANSIWDYIRIGGGK